MTKEEFLDHLRDDDEFRREVATILNDMLSVNADVSHDGTLRVGVALGQGSMSEGECYVQARGSRWND